jgi:hypothetical protein
MRRSSRDADDLDSLNLLLDTVCNMFGIFIFEINFETSSTCVSGCRN